MKAWLVTSSLSSITPNDPRFRLIARAGPMAWRVSRVVTQRGVCRCIGT